MARKKVTKIKTKNTSQSKKKIAPKKSKIKNHTSNSSPNITLDDDYFLDSFDQFIADEKKELKTKNVLKQNIRASFNRDSSFENSVNDASSKYQLRSFKNSTDNDSKVLSRIEIDEEKENGSMQPSDLSSTPSLTSTNGWFYSDRKPVKRSQRLHAQHKRLFDSTDPSSTSLKIRSMTKDKVNLKNIEQNTDNLSSSVFFSTPISLQPKIAAINLGHSLLPIAGNQATSTPAINKNGKALDFSFTNDADHSCVSDNSSTFNNTSRSIMQSKPRSRVITRSRALHPTPKQRIIAETDLDSSKDNRSYESNDSLKIQNSKTPFKLTETEINISSSLDASKLIGPTQEHSIFTVDEFTEIFSICESSKHYSMITDKEKNEDDKNILDVGNSIKNITVETINVKEKKNSSEIEEMNKTVENHEENPNKKLNKRNVGFNVDCNIHELSQRNDTLDSSKKIMRKSGKWRRSLLRLQKTLTASKRKTFGDLNEIPKEKPNRLTSNRRKSIFIKDIVNRKTLLAVNESNNAIVLDESDVESNCSSDYSPKQTPINALSKQRISRLLDPIVRIDRERCSSLLDSELIHNNFLDTVIDEIDDLTSNLNLGYDPQKLKDQLLKQCGQSETLPFDEIYSATTLKKCRKIGEGVFGEVFLNETAKSAYVLKIIPIEGAIEINGAQQKKFDEILQEVIISQELSGLRHDKEYRTSGFVEVLNVRLVEGRYPTHLLDLWEEYKDRNGTENDDPDVFTDDQLYVVFELANGGLDLEAFVFKNADQSYAAFKQTAISLAVAETKFQFEHRDLHWGNILLVPTTEKTITFSINGKNIEILTHGVRATIIDYTLSRIVYKNCCLYQDLSADPELFEAAGDYQYDIYRLMKAQTNNCWETFEPYTNVLWLHYIIDKMISGVRYSSKKTIKHRRVIDEMMKLRDDMLEYKSASDFTVINY